MYVDALFIWTNTKALFKGIQDQTEAPNSSYVTILLRIINDWNNFVRECHYYNISDVLLQFHLVNTGLLLDMDTNKGLWPNIILSINTNYYDNNKVFKMVSHLCVQYLLYVARWLDLWM